MTPEQQAQKALELWKAKKRRQADNHLVECANCRMLRLRVFAELRPNGRKVFVGEDGRQWHGSRCPECRSQEFMARTRGQRKAVLDVSP